jgi:hypothetical protein
METKFKSGDLVTHPLGMACLVKQVFDTAIQKGKNEAGEDVETRTELPEAIYELEFYVDGVGLKTTNLNEALLQPRTEL